MSTLQGSNGPIECHEPRPGCYFAASGWTSAEAAAYLETGTYPERLSAAIRAEFLAAREARQ